MGIKDLAKLGFERDKERDKRATQLVARPVTRHPPVRQPTTLAQQPATGAAAWEAPRPTAGTTTPCRDAPDTAGAYERPPQPAWDAADWRAYYEERATLRGHGGQRPRLEAERLAWGEMQNEWHSRHGEHAPAWQCAGCRKPIGGQPIFAFPDGARAHDDLACIAVYGKRWRTAATAALVALGLLRPAVVPEDEP